MKDSMELTAVVLNNKIVKLRPIIAQARFRISSHLIRRAKQVRLKKGTDTQKKSNEKKAERFIQEVAALKRIRPDEITKFAMVNTKKLNEFKIASDTDATDRAMYKVATCKVLCDAIVEFREKYPTWYQSVPFLLQRLGKQYTHKQKRNQNDPGTVKENLKLAGEEDQGEGHSSEAEKGRETAEKGKKKLKKMKTTKSTDLKEKTATLKKTKKVKKSDSNSPAASRTKKSTGVVQRLKMDDIIKNKCLDKLPIQQHPHQQLPVSVPVNPPSSTFFVGGVETDEPKPEWREKAKIREVPTRNPERSRRNVVQRKQSYPASTRNNRHLNVTDSNRIPLTQEKQFQQSTKPVDPATHPSWVAKQKEKMELQRALQGQSGGKKIKFAEDD